MENLNLNKQKLYALIIAGVALISLFLPWASVSIRGYGGNSVNGLKGWGFLALAGVASVVVASLMEDKTKEYMGNMKMIAMGGFGAMILAAVVTFIRLSSAKGKGGELDFGGMVKVSAGLGLFLCAIAGVLGLLWVMGIVKLPQKPAPPKA
ncbi:MAG TPA: hypothetical protein VN451_07220 [Chitinophagaceae bacterium]|nr:hypothetical protein [Chitinophagaceae bacterium]